VNPTLRFMPEQGSTMAGRVDDLFYFLMAVSIVMTLVIAGFIFYFGVKYRRGRRGYAPVHGTGKIGKEDSRRVALEIVWIAGPLFVNLVMFVWGARLFAAMAQPPADAMEIFVVGKQWMWHTQHLGGQREINEIHVPVGRPVKLTMTSEDVIHSFFIPAFRVKADVLPGRYNSLWFEATKPGEYHLFCTEYCGTKHSSMIGHVIALDPPAYQAWLSQGGEGSLASRGEKLFQDLGCATCHQRGAQSRGPALNGLFGSRVELQNGTQVPADETYLRESIIAPGAKVVAGYQPIMPTYVAQVDEAGLIQLIAYIRSLQEPAGRAPVASPAWGTPAPAGSADRGGHAPPPAHSGEVVKPGPRVP
jgi:cytochrome c oxidase subunit II